MASSFGTEADRYFGLLNPLICKFYSAGTPFSLRETADSGKADVTCTSLCACLHVDSADDHCFPVLSNHRCADHLILLYDAARKVWRLHIFELTKSVSNSK